MRSPKVEFLQVADAAARVFIRNGYARTQVQDIADELGVAKGTVYLYAQNKEALLTAGLRFADRHEDAPTRAELPLRAQDSASVAELVRHRIATEVGTLVLRLADSEVAVTDVAGLVVDFYDCLARHRVAIKLVDRCAAEIPDLAQVWYGQGRDQQVDLLEELLDAGRSSGALVVPGDSAFIARTIVELVALWAVHCHFEANAGSVPNDESEIASTLGEFIARAIRP